ncbi:MAG: TRP75-related protein [Wolbachia pipientis]|nr:TRP75-related protein [Wolbachia pipientis]
MPKIFSGVLFIPMFLISSFLIINTTEAKSKIKLSEKYKPPGNPGGTNFYKDEDFAESYKLYEKRRKLLKKKKLQNQANTNINKENLAKKLKKKINILNNRLSNSEACIINDEKEAMINQHGINLARLKGAIFIDQEQVPKYKNEQCKDKYQEETKVKATQEKKNPPINIVKNTLLKKTCSHDAITDLDNETQRNLSSSNLPKSETTNTTKQTEQHVK